MSMARDADLSEHWRESGAGEKESPRHSLLGGSQAIVEGLNVINTKTASKQFVARRPGCWGRESRA